MTPNLPAELPSALVSATDIARLARVQRPAVSNWRRRYADFPQPVAGTAANPLFSFDEVETWCGRHEKPFEAGPADRLWQQAQALVDSVRMADFLAHAGMALAPQRSSAALPSEPDPQWKELLAQTSRAGGGELYRDLCARYSETYGRRVAAASGDLAELMAVLGGVDATTTVLDPACGTGSLLLAAAERGAPELLAQDRDPALGHIALAQLLLAGRRTRLAVGDTLRDDGFPAESTEAVDVVLCDPPFRDRHWGQAELADDPRWRYGLPPRGESELAWVQHCLAKVRPGGRVVVLMPAAAAHRRTGRRIRANLLRSAALRAVIEPPEHGDNPGVHLWVLRAPESDDRPAYLLTVSGAATVREIVTAWTAFGAGDLDSLGACGNAVPVIDLLDEETDLRPAAHRGGEPHADLAAEFAGVREELDAVLVAARAALPVLRPERAPRGTAATTVAALVESGVLELRRAPLAMRTDGGSRSVLTLDDVRRGRSATGWTEDAADLVALRAGDVVVPGSGRETAARVVREAGAVLGPRLVLLRPVDDRVDPDFLAAAISWGGGPGRRRTGSSRSDIRNIPLPVRSLDHQRTYSAALHGLSETVERLRHATELGERLTRLGRVGLCDGVLSPGADP